jgi:cell division transport system ATP-binding protein
MSEESIIEISNASVYQKNILILSNVNITINKGEFAYLIGKTGTGKSSLLKMLYADLPLVDGEATIASFNLKTI